MKRLFIVALLMGMASPAWGGFKTGNELLGDCQNKLDIAQMYCQAYIIGVSDTVDSDYFCIPATAVQSQLKDVAYSWLKANPADRHLSAAYLVLRALGEAFPCPK